MSTLYREERKFQELRVGAAPVAVDSVQNEVALVNVVVAVVAAAVAAGRHGVLVLAVLL